MKDMHYKLFSAVVVTGGLVFLIALFATDAFRSARFEDVSASDRPYQNIWGATTDVTGIVSLSMRPPGLTLHSFQDEDTGTPEITSTLTDPAHRRYVYISVRIDQNYDHGVSNGPFTSKIYRYDIETGTLVRIYRNAGGSGYDFLGFNGNKLIVVDFPYGDNSPGPCSWDEVLTGETLTYIDVSRPQMGVKTFVPSHKFKAQRAKALATCYENPFGL